MALGKGKTTPQAVNADWCKRADLLPLAQVNTVLGIRVRGTRRSSSKIAGEGKPQVLKRQVADPVSGICQILKEVDGGKLSSSLSMANVDDRRAIEHVRYSKLGPAVKWCTGSAGLAGCWVRHVPPSVVTPKIAEHTKMSWWQRMTQLGQRITALLPMVTFGSRLYCDWEASPEVNHKRIAFRLWSARSA